MRPSVVHVAGHTGLIGSAVLRRLPINVGSGHDLSIKELAAIVGYSGAIKWDIQKPDGAPRKLLDSSRILAAGWRTSIGLQDGISGTYAWYQSNVKTAEAAN